MAETYFDPPTSSHNSSVIGTGTWIFIACLFSARKSMQILRPSSCFEVNRTGLPQVLILSVVQYGALQGGWNGRKLSGTDRLSGLGGTRVNNCTVLIFNYSILFS